MITVQTLKVFVILVSFSGLVRLRIQLYIVQANILLINRGKETECLKFWESSVLFRLHEKINWKHNRDTDKWAGLKELVQSHLKTPLLF